MLEPACEPIQARCKKRTESFASQIKLESRTTLNNPRLTNHEPKKENDIEIIKYLRFLSLRTKPSSNRIFQTRFERTQTDFHELEF